MTGLEIINTYEALASIMNNTFDLDTACAIAKNMRELSIPREIIDKRRNELIKQFCSNKDENGEMIIEEDGTVKLSDTDAFNEAITSMLNEDTDVNLTMIDKSSLSDIKISPYIANALLSIIKY